jgi:hypothetical protein
MMLYGGDCRILTDCSCSSFSPFADGCFWSASYEIGARQSCIRHARVEQLLDGRPVGYHQDGEKPRQEAIEVRFGPVRLVLLAFQRFVR